VYIQKSALYGVFQIEQEKHIGIIIKELREYRGISQETLAREAFFNRSKLSQIELGNQDCPNDVLLAIKTKLDIVGLPIKESDRPEFRDTLHKWYELISERKWEEAKELRIKLSIIKLLPHDVELNNLFSLFECRLLLGLNDLTASKDILDNFETVLSGLTDIQKYHYHYNYGTYSVKSKLNNQALDYYLKAYELMKLGLEKNITLYFNIAICYERLGQVSRAVTFLEEACTLHPHSQNNVPKFYLYNFLGVSYARVGLLQRAKTMLDKAHSIAFDEHKASESDDSKTHMCMVYINYGFLFRMAKKWNRAIEYLDKSISFADKSTTNYIEAVYQKTRVLIEMGNTLSCNSLLSEGVLLSKANEVYTLMFEALKHMINTTDDSAKILETKILRYMLDNNIMYPALDYATFLRDYYRIRGRGFKTRALEMSDTVCNIFNQMHEGGVIE